MLFSTSLRRIAVPLSVAILAGCASTSSRMVPPVSGADAIVPHVAPCSTGSGYLFNGPCGNFTLTSKGGTSKLPAYKGFTFSYTVPPNTFPGKAAYSLGVATGAGDITGKVGGKAFPAVKGALLYGVTVVAKSTPPFQPKGQFKVTIVASTPIKGKTCKAADLDKGTWVTQITAKPSGNKVVFSRTEAQAFLVPGKIYSAFYCK